MFWIVLATAGSCAGCSLLTLGVLFLGAFTEDVGAAPAVVSGSGALPTGNTPDLSPGSPGWLPSGRGVSIPDAEVVDGRPQGLWWTFKLQGDGKTWGAGLTLFLPDGTCATHPRPGGGYLFDLEGQRAQRGNTGLGTFEVVEEKITLHIDGYDSTASFESGSDGEGPFFKVGAHKYQPLTPPTAESLVGNWKSASGKFIFRADGTFEQGNVLFTEGYVVAAGGQGRWQLDGYLLWVRPPDAPSWITTVGMTGENFLIVGSTVYTRR